MTFYKLRCRGLYLKPAYRSSDWVSDPEKGKSYQSQASARSAAIGFLRATNGRGHERLTEILGRHPVASDFELVEFTATETGVASV